MHTDTDSTFCFHEGSGRVAAVPCAKWIPKVEMSPLGSVVSATEIPKHDAKQQPKKHLGGATRGDVGRFELGPWESPRSTKIGNTPPAQNVNIAAVFARALDAAEKQDFNKNSVFPYFRMFLENSVLFSPFSDILKYYFYFFARRFAQTLGIFSTWKTKHIIFPCAQISADFLILI